MMRIAIGLIAALMLGCSAAESKDEPQAASSPVVHMVSMNMRSMKFHEPGCRYYGCDNCEPVEVTRAIAMGGVHCKVCMP